VRDLTATFPYNDIEALERLFEAHPGQIACVVMEPVGVEPPRDGYLQAVRDLTAREGALLVFDEIITGFRLALGGAQEVYGVTPDLACFGKALANGMPLSAVVGRRDAMMVFDEIFFSGTFGGEALSLAAADATIRRLVDDDVLGHVHSYGERLLASFAGLIADEGMSDDLVLLGFPARSVLQFPHHDEREGRLRRSYFMQECVKRGLLYFGSHLPTASHGDDELAFTQGVLAEVVPLFADAVRSDAVEARLEGECVEAIFRRA
jgi:glutamate-1-semialdehyde 2,1-aminomutase/spore coat polysaccharide biosynthesis protein SpsF